MKKPENLSESSQFFNELRQAWGQVCRNYGVKKVNTDPTFKKVAQLANKVINNEIRLPKFEEEMRVILSAEGVRPVAAVAERTAEWVGHLQHKYTHKARPKTKLERQEQRIKRIEEKLGLKSDEVN